MDDRRWFLLGTAATAGVLPRRSTLDRVRAARQLAHDRATAWGHLLPLARLHGSLVLGDRGRRRNELQHRRWGRVSEHRCLGGLHKQAQQAQYPRRTPRLASDERVFNLRAYAAGYLDE